MDKVQLCVNSAKKFGGIPYDYQDVHDFIIGLCTPTSPLMVRIRIHSKWFMTFGLSHLLGTSSVRNSDGVFVDVQRIGEEHLHYLYGFTPTGRDWEKKSKCKSWINGVGGCLANYRQSPDVEVLQHPVPKEWEATLSKKGKGTKKKSTVQTSPLQKKWGQIDL